MDFSEINRNKDGDCPPKQAKDFVVPFRRGLNGFSPKVLLDVLPVGELQGNSEGLSGGVESTPLVNIQKTMENHHF